MSSLNSYHAVAPDKADSVVHIDATDSTMSIHSVIANVCGMLAMFLWKQTMDVIKNPERCISISYRPYLTWESTAEKTDAIDADDVVIIPPESVTN